MAYSIGIGMLKPMEVLPTTQGTRSLSTTSDEGVLVATVFVLGSPDVVIHTIRELTIKLPIKPLQLSGRDLHCSCFLGSS